MANTETGKYNVWSYSDLNNINLNTNYLNLFEEKWKNKIADTIWYVGGGRKTNFGVSNARTAYNYEIGSSKSTTEIFERPIERKIGLMYLSEYYYAADPSMWNNFGFNSSDNKDYRAAKTVNWMFNFVTEWTISRYVDDSNYAYIVNSDGGVNTYYVVYNSVAVRPTFNVIEDTFLFGGEGTQNHPYIIY